LAAASGGFWVVDAVTCDPAKLAGDEIAAIVVKPKPSLTNMALGTYDEEIVFVVGGQRVNLPVKATIREPAATAPPARTSTRAHTAPRREGDGSGGAPVRILPFVPLLKSAGSIVCGLLVFGVIVVIVVIAIKAAHQTSVPPIYDLDYKHLLHLGMTKEEVGKVLGESEKGNAVILGGLGCNGNGHLMLAFSGGRLAYARNDLNITDSVAAWSIKSKLDIPYQYGAVTWINKTTPKTKANAISDLDQEQATSPNGDKFRTEREVIKKVGYPDHKDVGQWSTGPYWVLFYPNGNLTIDSSGVYYIEATNPGGC
jgi:hypothetical protein